MSGIYLVGLPIGNNQDITLRALNTLKKANFIYCEDTRVFKELCKHIDVNLVGKSIESFHDHSSELKSQKIIEKAQDSICVFVSDAGSPIISDPAFPLIKLALENSIQIKTIPGVSAVNTALELSGLPPIPFHFHGFLGRDKADIKNGIETIKSQYGTHIIFEGKSRVEKTLDIISQELSDYDIVLARELTKDFESVYRFKGSDFPKLKSEIVIKGEFVILVYNSQKSSSVSNEAVLKLAQDILSKGAKPKLLSKLLAEITGKPSKEVYDQLNQSRQ